jgi:lipopolysaccharide/colanic/teichoic acid biosynthesis glycosyltransferase
MGAPGELGFNGWNGRNETEMPTHMRTAVSTLAYPRSDDSAVILSRYWSSQFHQAVKRIIDLVGAGLLLIALAPVFLFLAIAVKLSSPGEIFYRWKVVGKAGKPFLSYKFRSMVSNADDLKAQLEASNEMTGPVFKMTFDPRVTGLGKWMRRYSLDELPQLYSVLQGDMSLVGPRPPLVSEYELFSSFQRQKVSVKPGMTGLWQVEGRNQVKDFDQWVRLDLEYIRRWSLGLDLKILFRTVTAVFSGSGK